MDRRFINGYLGLMIFMAFIWSVMIGNRPIYDESSHILDIIIYAQDPLSGLLKQGNESGQSIYWYWGIVAKLFGPNYILLRISGYVVLFFLVYFLIKISENLKQKEALKFGLVCLLSAPYVMLTAGTLMTENFSLMLMFLALWLIQKDKYTSFLLFLTLSLCFLSRFFQLAFFACLLTYFTCFNRKFLLILLLSFCPFLVVVWLWGGLVPPGFSERYQGLFDTEIGLNMHRAIMAVLKIALYCFPLVLFQKPKPNLYLFVISLLMGLMCWKFNYYPWNVDLNFFVSSGNIDSAIHLMPTVKSQLILSTILVSCSCYALGMILIKLVQSIHLFKSQFFFICVFYILYYIGQQSLVSGNVAFFDRYIHMILVPIGFVFYSIFEKTTINKMEWGYFFCLNLLSIANLYKFLF